MTPSFNDPPARWSGRRLVLAGVLLAGVALVGLVLLRAHLAPDSVRRVRPVGATVVARQGRDADVWKVDAHTPPPEADLPVVPVIDPAMKDRLRAIHLRGLARGMRPDVLAKIGDSNTVDGAFLTELGCGRVDLGAYPQLAATVVYFAATELPPTGGYARCAAHNSWTRVGPAARVGWSAVHALRPFPVWTGRPVTRTSAVTNTIGVTSTAGAALTAPTASAAEVSVTTTLGSSSPITATAAISPTRRPPPPTPTPPPDCQEPDNTPIACELKLIHPGLALVMFGTNDLEAQVPLETFQGNLDRIAGDLIAAGVIPVLSTIPPRTDRPDADARVSLFNMAIVAVAKKHGVPLVNLRRTLGGAGMVDEGMQADGIHLSAFEHGAVFTPRGLAYGQNQRNLAVLQTLDKIRRIVYGDGAAEG
jgi:hypothetical protein